MDKIRYTSTLDLTDNGCFNTGWRIKQGDFNSIYLDLRIENNGVLFFDSSITPEIAFKRPDGKTVIGNMSNGSNSYIYDFVGNELAIAGEVVCDIKIVDSYSRISTASCKFTCVEDTMGYDTDGSNTYNNPVSVLVDEILSTSTNSEAWAVGTRNGEPVDPEDETYHNNAKYYAENGSGGSGSAIITGNKSPLKDSANGNIKALKLFGNSYKSKNLLKINVPLGNPSSVAVSNATPRTFEYNKYVLGLTLTNYFLRANITEFSLIENGFTFTGQGGYGVAFPIDLKAGNTYTLQFDRNVVGGLTGISYYDESGNYISHSQEMNGSGHVEATFTVPANTKQSVVCFGATNTSATWNVTNIMLNEGETALPYEPYGIIIPSGDVTSNNKNLCVDILNGYIDVNSSKIVSGSNTIAVFYAKANTTYTVSATSINRSIIARFTDKPQINSVGTIVLNQAGTTTYTITSDGWYAWYINNTITDNVMVEKGTSATEYIAHASSTVHTDRPLLSVNDIKNELIINADGSGKFVQRIEEVTFNQINRYIGYSNDYFYISGLNKKVGNTNILASVYDVVNVTSTNELLNGQMKGHTSNTNVYFKDNRATTRDGLLALIGNEKFVYELATPIETELTQTEVNALLALQTFENETYIDADGCAFEIKYNLYEPFDTLYSKVEALENKPSEEIYSTDEVAIGKWIDGRTIYRKMYSLPNISINTSKTDVTQYIDNAGEIRQVVKAYIMRNNNSKYGYFVSLGACYQENNNTIKLYSGSASTTDIDLAILEYTKNEASAISLLSEE